MTDGVLARREHRLSNRPPSIIVAISAVFVGLLAKAANADTITLSTATSRLGSASSNQGWWAERTPRIANNPNYFTGNLGDGTGANNPSEHRSFFTFDLRSLDFTTTRIVSASLVADGGRYGGDESSETLGLFDVVTPATALNQTLGFNPTIFADLGSGTMYGTFEVAHYQDNSNLAFGLNAAALRDIVSHQGSFFSIGGRLLSAGSAPADFIFGNTGPVPVTLVLETTPVPEPVSALLLATGLIGFVARTAHRRSATKSQQPPN